MGYFIPLDSGGCGIYINYYSIKDMCEQRGHSEESLLPIMEYVISQGDVFGIPLFVEGSNFEIVISIEKVVELQVGANGTQDGIQDGTH